jgi:hypothetical protein
VAESTDAETRVKCLAVLVRFAVVVCIFVAIYLLVSFSHGRFPVLKFRFCFGGWPGFLVVLFVTVACVFVGRRAMRQACFDMSIDELERLLPRTTVMSVLLAALFFGPKDSAHEMYRYSLHEHLHLMGDNMRWVFSYVGVMILASKPWRLVPRVGLTSVLAAAGALLLVDYVLAFVAFASIPFRGME